MNKTPWLESRWQECLWSHVKACREQHGTVEEKAWSDRRDLAAVNGEKGGTEAAWGWSVLGTGLFSPEWDDIHRRVK